MQDPEGLPDFESTEEDMHIWSNRWDFSGYDWCAGPAARGSGQGRRVGHSGTGPGVSMMAGQSTYRGAI